MDFQNNQAFARQLDKEDPLRQFRSQFIIPRHKDRDAIYFLGNSLGLQPKQTAGAIREVLDQWSRFGVEGFFMGEKPWLEFHRQLTPSLSTMVGAQSHEVVAMNQLTVNLHLMLVSFYQPTGRRTKILCEAKAFPSDQYMLATHVRQRGLNPADVIVEVQPREGDSLIRHEDILAAIDRHKEELALVFWGGVNYYTGQVFDMESITKAAHAAGAKAGFDLAHAVGNVPLQLHNWDADFACWCSYKYLNSGPGGIGGAFIHERYHTDSSLNRFAGWWGNKKATQFLMEKDFDPEASAEGWQLSTPSPLLYAAHRAALSIFEEAGFENVVAKNNRLNDYLWFVLDDIIRDMPPNSVRIFTPRNRSEKGCQVSLAVKNGREVFAQLSAEGVFADWREPDVIRVAPVGLYNTFEEVWQFGQIVKKAIVTFAA
ncbi:kynureninase [Flavisolibacter nicotianae]|uniref:kynureninase n=1 Tax=Flavisolibacter nicotianae TaxID=2364882 RepID=UPI000EAE4093|nr:kynureninase [Flavisolibacter nicotianae]